MAITVAIAIAIAMALWPTLHYQQSHCHSLTAAAFVPHWRLLSPAAATSLCLVATLLSFCCRHSKSWQRFRLGALGHAAGCVAASPLIMPNVISNYCKFSLLTFFYALFFVCFRFCILLCISNALFVPAAGLDFSFRRLPLLFNIFAVNLALF